MARLRSTGAGVRSEVSMEDSPEVSMEGSPEVSMEGSPEVSMEDGPGVAGGEGFADREVYKQRFRSVKHGSGPSDVRSAHVPTAVCGFR
jgi:hypothetical protein